MKHSNDVMYQTNHAQRVLELLDKQGIRRPSDLDSIEIPRVILTRIGSRYYLVDRRYHFSCLGYLTHTGHAGVGTIGPLPHARSNTIMGCDMACCSLCRVTFGGLIRVKLSRRAGQRREFAEIVR